ncbi:MAG TPA: GGDEF domain-containing protein [Holophagaceae bacterium]|nr:GGDEF domain-containing protein [Holophagaceae bacterium]
MDLISPLRYSDEDRPHIPAVREALVEELELRGQVALGALLPVLGLLWATLQHAARRDHRIEWLLAAALAAAIVRAILNSWRKGGPGARHLRFTLGSTFVALLLSATTWLAFPLLTPMEVGLLGMICAGLGSAALVSMAPSPTTYLVYLTPIIGTLAVASHVHPVADHPEIFQILSWLFLLSLAVLSIRVHRSLRNEILLRLRSRELAMRDTLTKLHNRRFLAEFMEHETAQALRAWKQPDGRRLTLKLLIIDLDRFKQVNDKHGHEAGDAVLCQLADILRETLRRPDIVVRWGGEEFVVVARDTGRVLPLGLAERIRRKVAGHPFRLPDGTELKCTCSIGFALYPFLPDAPERITWEQCVSLADAGLYFAKEEGRDRWVGLEAGAAPWEEGEGTLNAVHADPAGSERTGLVRLVREEA